MIKLDNTNCNQHVKRYYIYHWIAACIDDPIATRQHRDNLNHFKKGDAVY